MRTIISICVIGLLLTFGSSIMALAEKSVIPLTPEAVPEANPSSSDDQGVQSRGFFPKLPPPPKVPKIRSLSTAEKNLAKSVFQNTINYDLVKVTDTLGAGGRPWTTNTPPMYMINVGSNYPSLTANDERKLLLIHELTHVWQWQNRARTGYHPLRAAAEHGNSDDPYLFDLDGAPAFLRYGYEQQGAIVEEYVCCRALAPEAARTKRLHAMLKGAFPVSDLPQSRESEVYLPWKQAELRGICD